MVASQCVRSNPVRPDPYDRLHSPSPLLSTLHTPELRWRVVQLTVAVTNWREESDLSSDLHPFFPLFSCCFPTWIQNISGRGKFHTGKYTWLCVQLCLIEKRILVNLIFIDFLDFQVKSELNCFETEFRLKIQIGFYRTVSNRLELNWNWELELKVVEIVFAPRD